MATNIYSVETKKNCFAAYMDGMSLRDSADRFHVNIDTLRGWSSSGKWHVHKRELEEQAQVNFMAKYRGLVMDKRIDVTQRNILMAEVIDTRLFDIFEEKDKDGKPTYLSPANMKDLTSAAKASADIASRAVGVSDKADPLAISGGGTISGPSTIVNIGMMPSPIDTVPEADIVEEPRKAPFM